MTNTSDIASAPVTHMDSQKLQVKEHWEREVCGSRYGDVELRDRRRFFEQIERERDVQEPKLREFAKFDASSGKRVLEVGLGMGTDLVRWARAGAVVTGRDLTQASVTAVRERLALEGLQGDIAVGDAENLEFPDDTFDIYYSWGVLHHTPNTERALAEAHRVLRPGGELRVMLYHWPSVGALLVWLAQGPLRGRFIGPRTAYFRYVESPGTQMFSRRAARELAAKYFRPETIRVSTHIAAGDLINHKLSARYRNSVWRVAQLLYPRWFVRHVLGDRFGTNLTLTAVK
jgi:ubiquinone/menaquinone biosynthesis C-methylase UbiE